MKLFVFRLVAWLAARVPRRLAYALAGLAGNVIYLFKRRERFEMAWNLRRVLEFAGRPANSAQLRRMAREVYRNFCKNIVDFFSSHAWTPEAFARIVDASEITVIEDALKQGRGVILVTAHLGNWELGARAMARHGIKLNVVALQQPDAAMNALFQSQRGHGGINVITTGRAARDCLQALRRNEVVAIVADRDFSEARNLVTFFGSPARMPSGPARLAVATGALVVSAVCVRKPDDTFKIFYDAPLSPPKDQSDAAPLSRMIAKAFEARIAKFPSQWCIFHDYWNVERDLEICSTAVKQSDKKKD